VGILTLGRYVVTFGRAPLAPPLHARLDTLELLMSDLTASVDALRGAVDGVAQRLLPRLVELEAALAAAQADDADAAALLAQAETAAAAIRTEVDRLNALGAEPATPVNEAAPNADTVPDVQVPAEAEDADEAPADEAAEDGGTTE
jgi:hypothetical protein